MLKIESCSFQEQEKIHNIKEEKQDLFKIRSCTQKEEMPVTQHIIVGKLPKVKEKINDIIKKLKKENPELKFYVLRETRLNDLIFPALKVEN